jgi:hypothetical protein
MTLLLKSSIEFVDIPSPSASSSSSSSSSSPKSASVKSSWRSHRNVEAAKLAADLLAMMFRSRAAAAVSAAELAAPLAPTSSPALVDAHDHDDDDDNVDDVVVVDNFDNFEHETAVDDYCEPADDAPHPGAEEVEFSGAERHAFDLADRFDRSAPKTRHSGKRRPKILRRRPAVHRPQVEHYQTSVRTLTEAEMTAPPTVVAPAPVAAAPRSVRASPERDSWGTYRATPAAAAAQAALHIDANLARTCGLSTAQLTALMTRELSPADYEMLLALDNAVKPKTIEEDSLAKLLLAVVAGDVAADDVCMICLDEMASAALASLAKLPCKHVFHGACIREHLAKFSRRCPVDNLSLEN